MLPGSWLGADPSKETSEQPVTSQKRSELSSEYKLKFRPFSDYSYVDGQCSGVRDAPDGETASGGQQANAVPWYEEVLELRKKASSYKVRGWGREMAEPHLVHLYSSKEEDPTALAERKIISALYLETLKPAFVREERGRSPTTTGGAGIRQQSHPPPSSRKSPGAAKMALKLPTAEGGRRPHSAQPSQPSSERPHGDTVDKGRSPATPRTPTSKPSSSVPAAAKVTKKRPSVERPPAEKATPRETSDKLTRGGSVDSKQPKQAIAEKTEKATRPSTAKHGKAEKAAKSPRPAQESSSGTPESGKGIRGGTPRSRSAHRLAAKAKSPTKEDKSAMEQSSMTASAPAGTEAESAKPDEQTKQDTKHEELKAASQPLVTKDAEMTNIDDKKDVESGKEGVAGKQEEMARSAPEPTRMKSPDGMAPIKSPEPVNWTVPLDTGKTFTVTQNVIGGHGSPQSSRADSLRSPGEEPVRSPHQRGVTDVSHLRNGEVGESPLAHMPHSNGDDPDARSREVPYHAGRPVAEDPMTASMTAGDLQRSFHEDSDGGMKGSFHADVDSTARSMTGDDMQRSLHGEEAMNDTNRSYHAGQGDPMQKSFHGMENPMTASMTADDLKRSFHAEDQMTASMTGSDLKRSFHEDPMTASMTGDDLKRSFHASDPMTASMTGEDLQRSFHGDDPLGATSVVANKPSPPHRDPPVISSYFSHPAASEPTDRSPSTGLFSPGSTEPAPQPTSSLFSSGFAQPAPSLFSAEPPKSSLFSAGTAEPASSLFSASSETMKPAVSMFSSASAEPASGLFSSGSAEYAAKPSSGLFSAGSAEPASGLFSAGSAEPGSGLFSSGSAGPPRFSSDLFSSTGRQSTEAKPDAAKGAYRVI